MIINQHNTEHVENSGPLAPAAKPMKSRVPVSMCFSYDLYRPQVLEAIMDEVDAIELCPDVIAYFKDGQIFADEYVMRQMTEIGKAKQIFLHGIGLNLGSRNGMNPRYLAILDHLFDRLDIQWQSEHLSFYKEDNRCPDKMNAIGETPEMLETIVNRVAWMTTRYGVPLLLENVQGSFSLQRSGYTSGTFTKTLADITGSGIAIDVYSLLLDSRKTHMPATVFLDTLPPSSIQEIHFKGGLASQEFGRRTTSEKIHAEMLGITRTILAKSEGVQLLTYELRPTDYTRFPPAEIVDHIKQIKKEFMLN